MNSTVTAGPKRRLKPDAAGVFVPMTRERLAQLDADRAELGLSRGGALAALYDSLRSEAMGAVLEGRQADAAAAESLQPLTDTVLALADAWQQRARQRQAIGVHTNQLARYANALSGRQSLDGDVAGLRDAITSMHSLLERQAGVELEDQELVKQVRDLATRWVVGS